MDECTVKIEKEVYGGKGLARIDGQVLFVPYALAGETVRVMVTKKHKDYLEGEIIEVVTPSPERVPPDCRYFGRCGGCQISHATYQHQVESKRKILIETFERNKIAFSDPEIIPGNPFGYRHRTQLKYSARRRQLGFFEKGTNQIVDIQQCLCLTPGLNHVLNALRNALSSTPVPNLSEIECYENEAGQTATYFNSRIPSELREELSSVTQVFGPDELEETSLMLKFRESEFPLNPGVFLQVNPGLWKAMIQEVENHFLNQAHAIVVELYCGAGFFTVAIAGHVWKVFACEENEKAFHFARTHHAAKNIEWVHKRAEEYRFPNDVTAVLVDPPRTGLHKNVISQVLKTKPERITYVSCDPTSLARDLRLLSQNYRIGRTVLLDLFAQTYHFETIVQLFAR